MERRKFLQKSALLLSAAPLVPLISAIKPDKVSKPPRGLSQRNNQVPGCGYKFIFSKVSNQTNYLQRYFERHPLWWTPYHLELKPYHRVKISEYLDATCILFGYSWSLFIKPGTAIEPFPNGKIRLITKKHKIEYLFYPGSLIK